jgi:hypothetical protein
MSERVSVHARTSQILSIHGFGGLQGNPFLGDSEPHPVKRAASGDSLPLRTPAKRAKDAAERTVEGLAHSLREQFLAQRNLGVPLRRVFHALDHDHTGRVTLDEFRNGVAAMGLELSDRDMVEVASLLNAEDGLVSYERLLTFIELPSSEEVRRRRKKRAPAPEEAPSTMAPASESASPVVFELATASTDAELMEAARKAILAAAATSAAIPKLQDVSIPEPAEEPPRASARKRVERDEGGEGSFDLAPTVSQPFAFVGGSTVMVNSRHSPQEDSPVGHRARRARLAEAEPEAVAAAAPPNQPRSRPRIKSRVDHHKGDSIGDVFRAAAEEVAAPSVSEYEAMVLCLAAISVAREALDLPADLVRLTKRAIFTKHARLVLAARRYKASRDQEALVRDVLSVATELLRTRE